MAELANELEKKGKPPALLIDWINTNGTPQQIDAIWKGIDLHLIRLEAHTPGANKLTPAQRRSMIAERLGLSEYAVNLPATTTRDSRISTFRDADACIAYVCVKENILSQEEAGTMLRDTFEYREKQWFEKVADNDREAQNLQRTLNKPEVQNALKKAPHVAEILQCYSTYLTVQPLVDSAAARLAQKGYRGLDVARESYKNLNSSTLEFITKPGSVVTPVGLAERLVAARYLYGKTDYFGRPADNKLLRAAHALYAQEVSNSAEGVVRSTMGRLRGLFQQLLIDAYNKGTIKKRLFFDSHGQAGNLKNAESINPERTLRVITAVSPNAALPIFEELAKHVLQGGKLIDFQGIAGLSIPYGSYTAADWPAALYKFFVNVLTLEETDPGIALIAQDQDRIMREIKQALVAAARE